MERWVPALSALAGRSSSRDPNVDPGTRSDPHIVESKLPSSLLVVGLPQHTVSHVLDDCLRGGAVDLGPHIPRSDCTERR